MPHSGPPPHRSIELVESGRSHSLRFVQLMTPADSSLWSGNRSAQMYRTLLAVWRSTGGSIGSEGSQTIGQISGARCHDVGKDRDPTPVAGVHAGIVLHEQIDHLGSVRQCAVQMVQRRPAVFIACVRQVWIVRQQHANPVGSIAADRIMNYRRDRSAGRRCRSA